MQVSGFLAYGSRAEWHVPFTGACHLEVNVLGLRDNFPHLDCCAFGQLLATFARVVDETVTANWHGFEPANSL